MGKEPYNFKKGLNVENVGILLWFDNALVTISPTIYDITGEDSVVMKNQDRPGPKNTNYGLNRNGGRSVRLVPNVE